jgi:hypothetical protein
MEVDMQWSVTLDEIPLVLDDSTPSLLVSVDFEIEYELTEWNLSSGLGKYHQVRVSNIEPTELTFGNGPLNGCDSSGTPYPWVLEALDQYKHQIEKDATEGDLSRTLVERGDG